MKIDKNGHFNFGCKEKSCIFAIRKMEVETKIER